MKITVVVLPSIEEQRAAGDPEPLDPVVLRLPVDPVLVFRNFQHVMPDDVMGHASNFRIEKGRLVADMDLLLQPSEHEAFGISFRRDRIVGETTTGATLFSIGTYPKPPALPG